MAKEGRPHSRVHGFRARGRRTHGNGSSCDVGALALYDLRDSMFAHPTMTEGLKALFMAVPQRSDSMRFEVRSLIKFSGEGGRGKGLLLYFTQRIMRFCRCVVSDAAVRIKF